MIKYSTVYISTLITYTFKNNFNKQESTCKFIFWTYKNCTVRSAKKSLQKYLEDNINNLTSLCSVFKNYKDIHDVKTKFQIYKVYNPEQYKDYQIKKSYNMM